MPMERHPIAFEWRKKKELGQPNQRHALFDYKKFYKD
jgi:hypothetical protein